MKIISGSVTNFGSYKHLDFDFNQGLTLIQGSTGSGKSTLCDIIPWILFGKTSKGGSADEIRSWGEKEATEGIIRFKDGTGVMRIRGKANDLYMFDTLGDELRGKDIPDTQKLISEKLGYDLQTYLSGSYINEFSQVSQFFTTTAKVRRSITEQIVDLALASRLTLSLTDKRKQVKSDLDEISAEIKSKTQLLEYMSKQDLELNKNKHSWEESNKKRLEAVKHQYDGMEKSRAHTILSLTTDASRLLEQVKQTPDSVPCGECGNEPNKNHKHNLEAEADRLLQAIEIEEKRKNIYETRIKEIEQEINPYTKKSNSNQTRLHLVGLERAQKQAQQELTDTELLLEAVETMRTTQVTSSITQLEETTNLILRKHFDGEIQVSFAAEDKDKLEATIYKDGNLASYTQLSKGQRQMLKLSFGVAVMKQVAQHNAVNFNTLWFDECLDGCSDQVRVKAYRLFEELSLIYENVFCVDHSEAFKSCFQNQIVVKLTDKGSQIET